MSQIHILYFVSLSIISLPTWEVHDNAHGVISSYIGDHTRDGVCSNKHECIIDQQCVSVVNPLSICHNLKETVVFVMIVDIED